MTRVNTIDSGVVSTRIAKQTSETELPAAPIWLPVEVETYEGTGSEVTTEAPLPISERRQPAKGAITGVSANAGFRLYANPSAQRTLYEGFLWHEPDRKAQTATAVNGPNNTFTVADGAGFLAGMLIWARGFGQAANNGLFQVTAASATTVVVGDSLDAEAAPPAGATLVMVGYEFASGALDVVTSSGSVAARRTLIFGAIPAANDTVQIGAVTYTFVSALTAANDVLIGATAAASASNLMAAITAGTGAGTTYGTGTTAHPDVTAAAGSTNIQVELTALAAGVVGHSIAVTVAAGTRITGGGNLTGGIDAIPHLPRLERASGSLDFTTLGLVSGQAVYIGDGSATGQFATGANSGVKRVRAVAAASIQLDKSEREMQSETGTGLKVRLFFGVAVKNAKDRQYFQMERQLGAPDDADPNAIQAQYLVGLSPGEMSIEIDSQSLVRTAFNFQGIDEELLPAGAALKSGERPAYIGEGTFNTSADVKHLNMAPVSQTEEAPDTYFGIPNSARFTLNNALNPYTGVGKATPYAINAATPEVGGNLTASFVDVAALRARRENDDVTVDAFLVKDNRGMVIDFPLVSVGGSPPEIARGEPITLSLDFTAGEATQVHDGYDHAVMMTFFDYLPDAAAA